MNILIKKATLVCPNHKFNNQVIDIEITNGIISAIDISINAKENYQIIEKDNLSVSLGWIDTQVVFGEPGFETTETISNGLFTAAKSGFTDVFIHSNTNPSIDNQATIHLIKNKALSSVTEAHVVGSMTVKSEGIDMAEMFDMSNAGAVAFGDYKKSTANANLLKLALQYTQNFNKSIFAFPMNKDIKGKGFVNEGAISTRLGMKGIPAIAEELELQRNITLLEYAGGHMHVPTISTKKAVELIKEAKSKGLNITCGVSINNIFLTDEELTDFNSNVKVYPPLRTESDKLALIEGLKEGTIDTITTDHCPVNIEQKRLEFDLADYGSLGLESAFGVLNQVLPIELIVEKLTFGYQFLNETPKIEVGSKAKFTLFTTEGTWEFKPENILSFSKNAIMLGKTMKGNVFGVVNGDRILI